MKNKINIMILVFLGINLQTTVFAGTLTNAVREDKTIHTEITKHRLNERVSFVRYTKGTKYLYVLHTELVFRQNKYNTALKID